MSKIIYDFLKDSFLYQDKYLFDNFFIFSDSDIKKELNKYKRYTLIVHKEKRYTRVFTKKPAIWLISLYNIGRQ